MIETDVLVVGAGPAGLATAISIVRGAEKRGMKPPRVVVLDKGRSPGSHVLSGAIVDPSGFDGFLTQEEVAQMPCEAKVVKESFRALLTQRKSVRIPWMPPRQTGPTAWMTYRAGSRNPGVRTALPVGQGPRARQARSRSS